MTTPDYGGNRAFPSQPLGSDGLPMHEPYLGMTLRDYFAAHALQGMLSGPIAGGIQAAAKERGKAEDEIVASAAYEFADALLSQREKNGG